MELITIEKNDLIELLNQANQPLLEKIDKLEKTIESPKSGEKKLNALDAAKYLGVSRKHLLGISYVEGEQNPSQRRKYKCTRLSRFLIYEMKVLDQIKADLADEKIA